MKSQIIAAICLAIITGNVQANDQVNAVDSLNLSGNAIPAYQVEEHSQAYKVDPPITEPKYPVDPPATTSTAVVPPVETTTEVEPPTTSTPTEPKYPVEPPVTTNPPVEPPVTSTPPSHQ
ncbi:hypothetical protein K502DRAFT_332867 [Neoconidiobolus thromboides FSU 785]|nr:hypothetical protein K502DRAFT_332867 [Neoconidiobolus thromboides FSU 785]